MSLRLFNFELGITNFVSLLFPRPKNGELLCSELRYNGQNAEPTRLLPIFRRVVTFRNWHSIGEQKRPSERSIRSTVSTHLTETLHLRRSIWSTDCMTCMIVRFSFPNLPPASFSMVSPTTCAARPPPAAPQPFHSALPTELLRQRPFPDDQTVVLLLF